MNIISRKHDTIIYPFFNLFKDYRNIYNNPTNDNLKIYLYKNSNNQNILKIKIILTINTKIQNIYTNINKNTNNKPKITFTLKTKTPYNKLIPNISNKIKNILKPSKSFNFPY